MCDNPYFSDTSTRVRDHFIVCGDYIIAPKQVVAVTTVFRDAEIAANAFRVMLSGGVDLEIWSPLYLDGEVDRHQARKTEEMRSDLLCQWRRLLTSSS